MKAQIEAVIEGFEHPTLGPTIDEVQVDAEASSRVTTHTNDNCHEKIEHIRTYLMPMKKRTQTPRGTTIL